MRHVPAEAFSSCPINDRKVRPLIRQSVSECLMFLSIRRNKNYAVESAGIEPNRKSKTRSNRLVLV
jgi:hypothetical protein